MKTKILQVRIEEDNKNEAEAIFKNIGLDLSTGVRNNAVIIESRRLCRAWYVPTRIKLSDEEIGKFISVRAEKNQKGKLRPLITIH